MKNKEQHLVFLMSFVKMSIWYRFLFVYFWVPSLHSANIFAIIPYPAKSHFTVAELLLKRLAQKGHHVDFATHYPGNSTIPRYNEISLVGSLPLYMNNMSILYAEQLSSYDFLYFITTKAGVDLCQTMLQLPVIRQIISSQKKYDLFITQIMGADCMLGFGHTFDAPIVTISTSTDLPWASSRLGGSNNPSYVPNFFVSSNSVMTLYERIENTVAWIFTKFMYQFRTSKKANAITRTYFGPNSPRVENLVQMTGLYLVNSHFSMNHVRPTVTLLEKEVGGLHMHESKPLTKYFENLLNTSSKGVIYLTMGSMIMTETFDVDKLQGMFDAFAQLPYKVLWKADVSKFPIELRIPDNIHFEKWMPQMDILCHPSVKLFVTHGGLLGSQEAIYCGVPRLGIPIYADQQTNIRTSEKQGTAIAVAYKNINKETILAAAKKLLNDKSYKENVEYVSKLFRDRPLTPLDTALYWVERVIKHKSAPKLENVALDISWYQYYLVDVGVVVGFGLSVCIYVVIFVLKPMLQSKSFKI